jgi:prepilin-type N-terminal cleavage/methylation domain-containing protein
MTLKDTNNHKAGFTLTELLVSVSIIVFILALILVNYNKFDTGIVLTNLAYDVGLSVRKAQTYGINVKGTNNNYSYSYGIHFDKSSTAAKQTYLIFADFNNNHIYDCTDPANTATCEKVEGFRLQGGYQIKDFYTVDCPTTCLSQLDILFTRPNPDAKIYTVNAGGSTLSATAATIELVSSRDTTDAKKVVVYVTGQISIK